MRAQLIVGASLLLALSACSPFPSQSQTTTTQPEAATTLTPTTTVPLVPGCPDEGEFVEGDEVARFERTPSDSTTVGVISWNETEACETFTVSFVTSEGAPATTPPSIVAAYMPGTPIIRITLDSEHTVLMDQLVETALVSRLYVVRALDGGMFIDLHLAAPAQARVEVFSSPAELTINLQPGIVEYQSGPAISDLVVVASPLDGALTSSPVEIFGYSRTFEANVLVIATAGNEVIAETHTTAADWVDTWGEYRVTLDLPEGDASIFVGEESPNDGSLQGLTIRLSVQ